MESSTKLRIFFEHSGHLILKHGLGQMSSDTGSLGTRLILISKGLRKVNPEALANGDIPLLNNVTRKLESIAKITSTSYSPTGKADIDRLRKNLTKFLKSSDYNERQQLSKNCEDLVEALQKHESINHILAKPPRSGRGEYPVSVKRKLLSGLRNNSICTCVGPDESQGSPRWHPTRLLLQQKPRQDDRRVIDFSAVVARVPEERWQNVCLSVPLENSERFAGESSPSSGPNHEQESDLVRGLFCYMLKNNAFARIRFVFRNGSFFSEHDVRDFGQRPCAGIGITLTTVLQKYTLQFKDKVDLAHMTAQALWQFYDTRLLYDKWNSDCILFMPEEHQGVRRVPIKPCVPVQFEVSEENIDEYLSEKLLPHRYPRILAFAIMLIEIGLGRPLQLQQWDSLATQVNTDFEVALQGLNELKETPLENSSCKSAFIKAIENCLRYENFGPIDTTSAAVPSPAGNQDGRRTSLQIDHTRRIFYTKVVWPLQWLAKTGASGLQSNSYLRENQRSLQISRASSTRNGLEEDIQFAPTEFHASRCINPKDWLRNLKAINKEIHPKLQNLVVDGQGVRVGERGIRVAILDTGYNPEAPLLAVEAAARCFKGWKDFVSGSDVPVDSFGHGTFMATVLIHSAPISEVHVARVAENTNNLGQCSHQVAEGIRWAAFEQNVDIISMSFGFPAFDNEAYGPISKAIDEVKMKRDGQIIFLASAGNSGVYEDETFPATHSSVISVRATNCLGEFTNTNPRRRSGDSEVFGAIGDDIPPHLRGFYPEVSLPGSSAATAVAAGTAVIMLAYVLILPQLLEIEIKYHKLKLLWTTEGMRRMFMKMSDDMGQQQRFLNPVKFFCNKPGHFDKYCAVYDCL
ncbi:peptidase S8/S53 domain-containing protein [Trichoderma sp. SZMC 28011]